MKSNIAIELKAEIRSVIHYSDHHFIKIVLLLIIFSGNSKICAQSAHEYLRKGDKTYKQGDYSGAETQYRKADEKTPELKSGYNLGNTLYQQERYEEATKAFENASSKAKTEKEKNAVYHNLGNSYFQQQKYKESIDAYKQALRHSPEDTDSKENLMYARTLLRQQQQQEQQKQQDQQDNKDKEENQDQQNNQDQQDQNQNKEDNQDNKSSDEKDKQDNQNQRPQSTMNRQDAEKLLDIINNEDKKVSEKMRRSADGTRRIKKDW